MDGVYSYILPIKATAMCDDDITVVILTCGRKESPFEMLIDDQIN